MGFRMFPGGIEMKDPFSTSGFLMFSGSIEVEHWLKMG